MAAFASYSDVEGRWRTLTAAEQTLATNLLTDASAIIRRELPDIDTRIAAGTLDAALTVMVATNMVIRRMKNPDGKRSEQIDDYAYTRDVSLSAGDLTLTTAERELLGVGARGAFSVRLHTESACWPAAVPCP